MLELDRKLPRTELVVRDGKWCYLLENSKIEGKAEGWRLDLESAEVIRLN